MVVFRMQQLYRQVVCPTAASSLSKVWGSGSQVATNDTAVEVTSTIGFQTY